MRYWWLIVVFLVPLCNAVEGQILTFDFAGLAGNEASANSNSNDANLGSSTITRGSGITASANADRFGSTGFTTGALDANDYVEFTITPNSGYQFSITSVVMKHQRSGTGPTGFAIRSSQDAYASDLATGTVADVTTIETTTFTYNLSSTTAVTFRIFAYSAEAGTGTWGPGEAVGNDIVVNGTVTTSDTKAEFTSTSGSVLETAGTYNLPLTITNPHATNTTTVRIELTAGDPSLTDDFASVGSTIDVVVPANTSSYNYALDINNNTMCGNNGDLSFEIISVTGGQGTPAIGTNNTYTLTITDEEMTTGAFETLSFEAGDNLGYSVTGSGSLSSTASKFNGTQSYRLEGVASLTTDNISLVGYSNVSFQVAFASNGPDGGEDLYLEVSYDNGSTWTGTGSVKLMDGFGNSNLNINTTNGTDPTTVSSNPYTVNIADGNSQVKVRVSSLYGLTATEYYYIDDIIFSGNYCACTGPTTQASNFSSASITGTTMTLNWTRGNGDEVLVVARAGSSVDAIPTSGTSYTGSAAYGSGDEVGDGNFVVYSGASTSVNLTSLMPGTTYYFSLFEFSNSDYCYNNSALTGNATTTAPGTYNSELFPGDLVIVGFDTYESNRNGNGSSGDDIISLVNLTPMANGTSFILANMVYDYKAPAGVAENKWYSGNGLLTADPPYFTVTYMGAGIAAGSVLCVYIDDNGQLYEVHVNGSVSADFSSDGGNLVQFSSSSPDAIFLMQGTFSGVLTDGALDKYRTFDGNVLGGIQTRGTFQAFSLAGNAGGSRVSRIHPHIECIAISRGASSSAFYGGYLGSAPHSGSQNSLISSIIDEGTNWDLGEGVLTEGIDEISDFVCANTFLVTSEVTPGLWKGSLNTNWFQCENWDNLVVPDSTIDVVIPTGAANNCLVDATSSNAEKYDFTAQAFSVSIQSAITLTLQNASSYLDVMEDFDNDGTFTHTAGKFRIKGSTLSTISGNNAIDFYDLVVRKSSDHVSLSRDIEVSNSLKLTNGVITTNASKVHVSNSNAGNITSYTSSSFINGNLRQSIASNTSTYNLPLGYSTATTDYHPMNFINNNLDAGVTYIDGYVSSITESGANDDPSLICAQDGTNLTELYEAAEWSLIPNAAPVSGDYGVQLYVVNIAGLTDDKFCPVKRTDVSADYADWDTYEATTTIPVAEAAGRIQSGGAGYAERLGYTDFSKHGIAGAPFVLPVELLSFEGIKSGEKAILKWKTASEINNDYFSLERSVDTKNWNELGTVLGSGTTSELNHYSYTDLKPNKGINYYRLKQVDFDGKFEYSKVVSLSFNDISKPFLAQVSTDKRSVILSENNFDQVDFVNSIGQTIYSVKLQEKQTLLNVPNEISTGVYFLRFTNKNTQEVVKIQF